ncbi:GIN domain-containing protein [Phenylobacterium sp.]|jgi:hypothetical protein|uniref:GIN domain-containing protein n=1 Tax=Phenylobacterium sp. TaxID=1871053 RepID=UPI002F3F4FBD
MRQFCAWTAAAFAMAAGGAQAASVELRDAVARVTVIPEARNDVKVEFVRENPRLPIKLRTAGDKLIIDGNLDRKIRGCRTVAGGVVVTVAGLGDVPLAEMPQIVIRTPRNVELASGGAVFGVIGRSANVDLSSAGCGDWTIGNVDGLLKLSQAGSGDARAGAAGQARLRVAGSGDITAARVRGPLEVDVAGSGDVSVMAISGPLNVRVAGSGDVKVGSGRASLMTVSIAGSGDVEFLGVAGALKARVAGSGDIHARRVTGPVEKHVLGSGAVTVG